MKPANKVMYGVVAGTVLIAIATLALVPIPQSWQGDWAAFHLPMTLSAVTACLHVGAAGLFLTALGAYKAGLRRAYMAISLSIVLTAIGTVQLPIMNGFDLWDSAWSTSGGVALPFLLAGLSMYLGVRSLGRLLELRTVLTRVGLVIPVVVVLSAAAALLPHVAVTAKEVAYDAGNGILLWGGLMNLLAALIILQVRRHIGAHYVNAMAWLAMALLAGFLIISLAFVHALFSVSTQDLTMKIIDLASIVSGVLWLTAAYAFNRTKEI